eukprot:1387264-Pyramimonas_sp.AAC.1
MKYRRRLRRITAAHCPFKSAYVADRCGHGSAKLSEYMFPQPLWKPFGEYVGEKEPQYSEFYG